MSNDLIFKRTRYAPTPSGFLHLGNIYSFVITAALAQKTGASILLRIDDFDMERTNKTYVQDIFDTLNFLDIPWHEGPRTVADYEQVYSLQFRMELYNVALKHLQHSGAVFACSCTRTDIIRRNPDSIYTGTCEQRGLSFDTNNVSWRLKTNSEELIQVKSYGAGNRVANLHASMNDFMVRKKDGFPAYQLISVVDDIHYEVDLVVRGEDLWPSSQAQIILSDFIANNNFRETTFYHHPLLKGPDGAKLAKSAGAISVHSLRSQYGKPGEIYQLLADIIGVKTEVKTWQDLAMAMGLLE